MDIRNFIQKEVIRLHKITLLENRKAQIEEKLKLLKENDAFNREGEPLMTHNQYRDYTEPSEPEEDFNDSHNFNPIKYLRDELQKNGILLETWDGKEYFIRCKRDKDFTLYKQGDNITVFIDPSDISKKEFDSEYEIDDLITYIVGFKDMFVPFNEAVKERNIEMKPDPEDKYKGYI
jgi:hypothetical protein